MYALKFKICQQMLSLVKYYYSSYLTVFFQLSFKGFKKLLERNWKETALFYRSTKAHSNLLASVSVAVGQSTT
jgi:hypothetical protein